MESLLPRTDPNANTILMGDFNSFAPDAGYDADYERKLAEFVAQHNGPHDYSYMLPRLRATRDTHDYGTIRRVLAHYQDAHPGPMESWYTLPTRIAKHEQHRPHEKIDYIFAAKHLVLERPKVHRDCLTDIISDHYPVSVDIRTESLK